MKTRRSFTKIMNADFAYLSIVKSAMDLFA